MWWGWGPSGDPLGMCSCTPGPKLGNKLLFLVGFAGTMTVGGRRCLLQKVLPHVAIPHGFIQRQEGQGRADRQAFLGEVT